MFCLVMFFVFYHVLFFCIYQAVQIFKSICVKVSTLILHEIIWFLTKLLFESIECEETRNTTRHNRTEHNRTKTHCFFFQSKLYSSSYSSKAFLHNPTMKSIHHKHNSSGADAAAATSSATGACFASVGWTLLRKYI